LKNIYLFKLIKLILYKTMDSYELSKIENITKFSNITLKNAELKIDRTKYTYNAIKLQSSGRIRLQKIEINM
jgi:hypothetical protein